ncbi:MAG: hypothetical protein MHM6MM_000996 [Cercozoa sp. M6MM]
MGQVQSGSSKGGRTQQQRRQKPREQRQREKEQQQQKQEQPEQQQEQQQQEQQPQERRSSAKRVRDDDTERDDDDSDDVIEEPGIEDVDDDDEDDILIEDDVSEELSRTQRRRRVIAPDSRGRRRRPRPHVDAELIDMEDEDKQTDDVSRKSRKRKPHTVVRKVLVWKHGGNDVYVAGTWDDMEARVKLNRRANGTFSATLALPAPATFDYRYVVDGQERHAVDQAVVDIDGVLFNRVTTAVGENDAVIQQEDEYGCEIPNEEHYRKDPPTMPPQLKSNVLAPSQTQAHTRDPQSLPPPSHVTLQHLYTARRRRKQVRSLKLDHATSSVGSTTNASGSTVPTLQQIVHKHKSTATSSECFRSAVTHRYRSKFVTTVFYRPPVRDAENARVAEPIQRPKRHAPTSVVMRPRHSSSRGTRSRTPTFVEPRSRTVSEHRRRSEQHDRESLSPLPEQPLRPQQPEAAVPEEVNPVDSDLQDDDDDIVVEAPSRNMSQLLLDDI